MDCVLLEEKDDIAVLRLNNGVTNAIGPQLVEDLEAALAECSARCKALILAGGVKFFSIGFDLPALLQFERRALADFYDRFNRTVLALFTLPVPTVCALGGHAIAGGTILALSADYRVGALGKKLVGLNEIKLGVPVPHLADLMLRLVVPERAATAIVYDGEFMSAADAAKIGLVDAVFDVEMVEARAFEKARAMSDRCLGAFAQIKESRTAAVRSEFESRHREKTEAFLACWFDPAVQGLLREAAGRF